MIRGINTLGVFATAALGAGFALAWVCFGRAPGVAAVDSVPHEPETRGQNESAAPPIDFGGEKFEEVLQSSSEILRVGDVRGALEHLAENLDRDDFSEALLRMVVKLDGDQAEAMFKLFIGLIQSSDKDELSNLLSHVDDMVIIALMDRWMIQSGDEIFDYAFSGEIPEDEGDEVGPDIAMLAIAMLLPRDRERAMNVLHRLKTDWPEHFGSVEDMDFGLMAAGMSMRSTAEAIAWVKQEWPDTEDYEELFENGIRDPHATYDEIMKLEDSELREEVLQSFFAFWVKMDPVGVMGVTDKAGADWKGELVQRIVKELVKLDPQKGMRYAIETGNERTALKTWMGIDPDASVGWLLENGDETKRLILLQQHEEQLPLDAGLRLLDSLSEIPELERDGDGLLGRWARSDPRAALEWALKEGAYDFDYVGAFAASALYRDEPSAALAAYAGLADNALRSEFRDRLIYEMTNHDPDAAEPWLDTLQGEERENAMATYYRELAEHDPEAAFSGAIERGSLKGAEGVVQVWARHEEASHVYKWTREAMVDSEAIRKSVISAWARQDPLEASEAILLDAGENTGALVEELVNAWAGHDEEGAAWFINRRLEGDPMRDHALRGFAARVSIKSPNSPEEWRENFDDPAELQRVLDALGESGGSN